MQSLKVHECDVSWDAINVHIELKTSNVLVLYLRCIFTALTPQKLIWPVTYL